MGRNLEKSATKTGKIRKNGKKRENWEENGKLAGSLPLRTGRAGYDPANRRPILGHCHNEKYETDKILTACLTKANARIFHGSGKPSGTGKVAN